MKTVAWLLCALALSNASRGQEGYTLQPGRVVVDSKEHWEHWQSAANTVRITDDGVRPVFIRKSTRLQTGRGEVVVPGVNAVRNAARFGGGIRAAGSNDAGAAALTDGSPDTYWEPDTSAPLEDWWVQIDLGRTVSATRIVLVFVEEDLGDPFLQFKVTTSQGEVNIGPMLYRTRFTTNRPVKRERVFEIDLTRQLPTKWPDATGGFTGDVIRYVGVAATDSDYDRARKVSRAEYERLPDERRGTVEYYRRDPSGRERLLLAREHWDALEGTGAQGSVVYYRRELPRLAEVEVWTVGDNIGTGVLERGGSVTSVENNGAEGTLVDGDFFGQVLYWPARGGYNAERLLPSEPADSERSLIIDLGGAFFLDNIRVLQIAARALTKPFPQYRIQLSDGSTHAGGSLAWTTVGRFRNAAASSASSSSTRHQQIYNNFRFPLTRARYFAFTYRMFPNVEEVRAADTFALSEIQFFGEGYMPETRVSSVFGGDSPFIELGRTPRNLASIEWDADLPPGTDLILQTRTGDAVESVTHYSKKNGEEYPGTEEEAAEAHASDKKFFGENSVGPVVAETIPGSDWSGWSQPYLRSGERITSPSPRKFAAVRATLLTEDPLKAATLRSVALNFVTPVARRIVGEVLPSRLERIGARQAFSYFVRSTFEADSRGFDEILIEAPEGVEMELKQVNVSAAGQPAATYTGASEGFAVVRESDSLWVRLPAPVRTTDGPVLVELEYETTLFGYNTFFTGSMGHSAYENSWQRVDDGDANGVADSETTVVLALQPGNVLEDIEADAGFTPNGDGVNDELSIAFSLMRVGSPVPVGMEIYDLGGRLVHRVGDAALETGRHTLTWTGADRAGATVPPGIYLLRLDVDVDSKSGRNTSIHRLAHVAY